MGQFRLPRIASSDRATSTWTVGELMYDSNQSLVYYGNGAAAGGVSLATGAGGGGGVAVSAAGSSHSDSTVVFSNSNNVSFGMNGRTITATATFAGGVGGVALSAAGSSQSAGTMVLSNSNGISFGMNGSTVTASHNGLTSQSNQALSGSNGSFAFQTATFGALNGISFYSSNGSLVASHNGLTSQSNQAFSAGAASSAFQTLVFQDSNGVSFSNNAGSLRVSHDLQFTSATSAITSNALHTSSPRINVSAGTTSNNLSVLVFSNSNGLAFGMNGSTVTGSYTVPSTAGLLSAVNVSAGTTSNNLSAVTFSNSHNVSFGLNGSVVTASASFAGGAGDGGIFASANGSSQSAGVIIWSNSNGVSFGMNGSTVTASHNGLTSQSNQQVSMFGVGNTTQSSSGTQGAANLSFRGEGYASIGISNGSVVVSVDVPDPGFTALNLSAGTTSANLTAFTLSNGNGVSFGLNAGTVTASHNGLTSQSNQAFSAGGGSSAFQTLVFANSNGASFTNTNGSVALSYTVPSLAGLLTAVNVSAGTTSNNLSALTFANANGLSFGLNGSTVTGSYSVPSTAGLLSAVNVSAGTTSNNLSALTFANGNGITFGLNASTLTASHNGITSQSVQSLGLYAVSNTTGQSSSSTFDARSLSFHGAGIASVGYSGGSVVISVPSGGGAGDGVNILAAGTQTAATTGSVLFSNSNGVSFGMSNSSIITANVSQATLSNSNNVSFGIAAGVITATATFAGDGFNRIAAGTRSATTLGSILFSNANGISFGLDAVNGSIVTASHNGLTNVGILAGGGGVTLSNIEFGDDNGVSWGLDGNSVTASFAVNISAGTTSTNAAAFTFANDGGVSFGLNGRTITASAPSGGGGKTLSYFAPYANRLVVAGQQGQATLHLNPVEFNDDLIIDRVAYPIYNSNSSNSSGSHTLSFWGGLYTKTGSSLSLAYSWSGSTAITHSGTAGSYSLFSGGPRLFTIGMTATITGSNYWLGVISRTTSGGANGTYSQFLVSAMASNFLGHFGSSHNTTYQSQLGRGIYTATTSAMPGSIGFTQIRGSDSIAQRPPVVVFMNGTV